MEKERIELCRSCEHFLKLTQQCAKCWCLMPLKVKIKSSECPEGKWGKEEDGN